MKPSLQDLQKKIDFFLRFKEERRGCDKTLGLEANRFLNPPTDVQPTMGQMSRGLGPLPAVK